MGMILGECDFVVRTLIVNLLERDLGVFLVFVVGQGLFIVGSTNLGQWQIARD